MFEPGPGAQLHDLNPSTFPPTGLFWTLAIPGDGIRVYFADGRASLEATDVPIFDYGTGLNAIFGGGPAPTRGTVSVHVTWTGVDERLQIRNRWNPVSHGAHGIWDVPHVDIHFYLEPRTAHILAIRSGSCGPEFVDCVHWEVGRKPLPPNYMHPNFQMGAVVPAMGGHLRDQMDPVYNKTQPAIHSWLFGAYDSNVIFYEAMVTRAFLLSNPNTCFSIKSPKAVALSGFYPTVSRVRHDAKIGEYTVSIENFVLREASGPEPVLAGK